MGSRQDLGELSEIGKGFVDVKKDMFEVHGEYSS